MIVQNAPHDRRAPLSAVWMRKNRSLHLFTIVIFQLFVSALAFPLDLSLKFEPGIAIPLGSPQADRFGIGGGGAVKALASLGQNVDIAVGFAFLGLPSVTAGVDPGTASAATLGLRLRPSRWRPSDGPMPTEKLFGMQPWLDADVEYVVTGPLQRFGFAAAVGLAFPLDANHAFWLGPFVRYNQIVQGDRPGFDGGDSMTLLVGLSLEVGTRLVSAVAAAPAPVQAVVACAQCAACPEAAVCPPVNAPVQDRDGDTVPDGVDGCPDMPGPASNGGCPVYEKIIVKADRLELKEKIQFVHNKPDIEKLSHPALYEVAKVMNEHKSIRVEVEGHASSEGEDEHNQSLSDQRASRVLEFLAEHGVARDRLKSKGFSSSRPLTSNSTEAGREANRRVEFVVVFNIVKGNAQ